MTEATTSNADGYGPVPARRRIAPSVTLEERTTLDLTLALTQEGTPALVFEVRYRVRVRRQSLFLARREGDRTRFVLHVGIDDRREE